MCALPVQGGRIDGCLGSHLTCDGAELHAGLCVGCFFFRAMPWSGLSVRALSLRAVFVAYAWVFVRRAVVQSCVGHSLSEGRANLLA